MSDCNEDLKDSNISFSIVSEMGLSDVGNSAMGSLEDVSWEVSAFYGPLTSMPVSACGLAGECLLGLDFAGLLVDVLDAPEEDSLYKMAVDCVVEGSPQPLLCIEALCSGREPFCCSPRWCAEKKSSILCGCIFLHLVILGWFGWLKAMCMAVDGASGLGCGQIL